MITIQEKIYNSEDKNNSNVNYDGDGYIRGLKPERFVE